MDVSFHASRHMDLEIEISASTLSKLTGLLEFRRGDSEFTLFANRGQLEELHRKLGKFLEEAEVAKAETAGEARE